MNNYYNSDDLSEVEKAVKELELQIRAARRVSNEAKREEMLKQAHTYVKQLLNTVDEIEFKRILAEERAKERGE